MAEIDGATEMRLGSELWAPIETENEKEFTLRTVLTILRKLRFQNVRYSHGKREFGRISFSPASLSFKRLNTGARR